MSDTGPLNLPGMGEGEPTGEPEVNPESLAGDFLKGIPDNERAIVEKYVKDWDAGVTKKFQSIHEQYQPYKELGEPDSIKQAIQLQQLIDSDPEYVYNMLAQEFGQSPGGPSGGSTETPSLPPELEGLPPQFVEQWQTQQTMMENLAQLVLAGRQETTEREEDAALENEMGRLKKQYGDFDEEYVLAKMWNGTSGDDAVKSYQNLTQNIINGQSKPKPQPPGLFGGGVIPTDTTDVSKLSGKDTRNLVAELLSQAHKDS